MSQNFWKSTNNESLQKGDLVNIRSKKTNKIYGANGSKFGYNFTTTFKENEVIKGIVKDIDADTLVITDNSDDNYKFTKKIKEDIEIVIDSTYSVRSPIAKGRNKKSRKIYKKKTKNTKRKKSRRSRRSRRFRKKKN